MKFPEQYRIQLRSPHGNAKDEANVAAIIKGLNISKYESKPGDPFGAFVVPAHKAPGRRRLNIIASDGELVGWDHVSVTLHNCPKQTPTWTEMCFIKSLFWEDSDWVVQFHPAKSKNISVHDGCLHLWKPVAGFPVPPEICV